MGKSGKIQLITMDKTKHSKILRISVNYLIRKETLLHNLSTVNKQKILLIEIKRKEVNFE